MYKRGPVDVLVVATGVPKFDGSVFAELQRQVANGTIRVLDAMLLVKGPEGKSWRLELRDLEKADQESLGIVSGETMGLFDAEDEDTLAEGMVPGSAICALAIEHTWAVDLVNAFANIGVEVALNTRIPAPIVDEAFAALAAKQV
jgi:hypothetical protein